MFCSLLAHDSGQCANRKRNCEEPAREDADRGDASLRGRRALSAARHRLAGALFRSGLAPPQLSCRHRASLSNAQYTGMVALYVYACEPA